MNILVTGAAGYIGSLLVPELLRRGHAVTAVDNLMFGQATLLECCADDRFTMVRGDARDRDLMARLLKGADVVVPLACLTGAPLCAKDPVGAQTINFDAIKMLHGLAGREQRFIFPTTNSGYGVGEKGKFCTEETPLRPLSIYGRLKVELEKYLLDSGNAVTFRLATVFGASPRMRLDLLVNDFTYRAVHDRFVVLFESHFKRNYLHVRDAVDVFLFAMDNFDRVKGQPYNVGLSEANLSKRELCEEIKKHVPSFYFVDAEVGEDPDKRDYIVSNEKIEAAGFKARRSLDFGIRELLRAYQIIKRNQYANV